MNIKSLIYLISHSKPTTKIEVKIKILLLRDSLYLKRLGEKTYHNNFSFIENLKMRYYSIGVYFKEF